MLRRKNIALIITSILLVAVLAILVIGITNSWFIASRKAEGTLEFVDGIKIEYSNMYVDQQNPTSKNLKLAYVEGGDLKALELTNVEDDQSFTLASPTIKAKEGTVPYYVRVRLNTNLYFKNANGENVLIDDDTRADFLATTAEYQKNDEPVVITNEKSLFKNLPELDTSNLVYYNGWYYLAEAGEVTSFEDLSLTECAYNGENTQSISFLSDGAKIELDNSIDFGEKMPFSRVEITLDIQAVEINAVSTWNN